MLCHTYYFWGPEGSQRPGTAAAPHYICAATHRPSGMAENVSGNQCLEKETSGAAYLCDLSTGCCTKGSPRCISPNVSVIDFVYC